MSTDLNQKLTGKQIFAGLVMAGIVIWFLQAWPSLTNSASVSAAPAAAQTPVTLTELLESHSEYDSSLGRNVIVGKVRNTSGRDLKYVAVSFSLYNDSGETVGTAFANIGNLEASGIWQFRAMFDTDAAKWKFKSIDAW